MDLQAGVVQKLSIKFDIWEILRNSSSGAKEETVTHLHDGSLVYCANLRPVDVFRILERES
jgi:hypothetical protein